MIKPFVILVNTIFVFLFSFFFGDSPVSITNNIPKTAMPNTEIITELVIKKGGVSGFAKLQLEVPAGFTVKELESKTGNFSFANNIAKIIWTSTPSDAEFTVKFVMIADASALGKHNITSKFSYVSNNVKEVVEMTPAEITIGDGNTTETPIAAVTEEPKKEEEPTQPIAAEPKTETPVNTEVVKTEVVSSAPTTNPTTTSSFSNPSDPSATIICSRTITKGATATEYNVEVKIKKGDIKGFAKFQEILPVGCTAKSGETSGSSFSVSDNKAKFVWVSLPADNEIVISYILETSTSTPADAQLSAGEFSYLENDQSKKSKLAPEGISASNTIASNTTTQNNTKTNQTTQTNTQIVESSNTTDNSATTNTQSNNTSLAKREGNVIYSVQIGAFRNSVSTETLSNKFKLSDNVKSEMAEGYNKFMIGDFNEYKQARTKRENTKQKGCASAFVVAYNGAKRITVQEALMITNQKWFQ